MCRKMLYLIPFMLTLALVSSVSAELVAHWNFDEGSGDTAFDSSGNNYHATLVDNPEWVTGRIGSFALNFDAGGYGGIQGLFYEGSGFPEVSVCAWIRTSSDAAQFIASFDRNEYWRFAIGSTNAAISAGQVGWHVQTDAGQIDYSSDTLVNDGQWHHVCGVYDNGIVTIYIDGEPEPSVEQGSTMGRGTLRYGYIGKNSEATTENQAGPGGNPVDGDIDDLRIYNHALTEGEILGVMAGQPWPYAFGPEPADGTMHGDTWLSLSWRPGDLAISHDVYFGDNFDDVDSGAESTFQSNQVETSFVVGFPGFAFPDGLVPGTTYYWRIDEVNEAEPNSPWKGPIWSFSIPPKTAYFPDPVDGAEGVDPDDDLSWTAGLGAILHYVYFGETFEEVNNAAGGPPHGTTTYDPGTLEMAKTYYWRVDEFDATETHKGNVWSFTTDGAVGSPSPAKGAVGVTQTPTLTWTPGFGTSYEVYFGADAASLELKASGNLGSESYEPGQLEWNTTYYWRVDEANNANADSPWTGPLWSFTTANFLIIDDMESYNDLNEDDPASNRIYNVWLDGYDDPTNGSQSGHLNPPFYEETIVHSGDKSMPIYYDNSVGKSEATLTLTSNRDWTVNGVDTLTIWYRGNRDNATETMYVTLNGSTTVDNDNPDAALRTSWTEWNIPLQAFADQGVNLANVNSITIGLSSGTGGTGMMYFDDIRLYPPAQ